MQKVYPIQRNIQGKLCFSEQAQVVKKMYILIQRIQVTFCFSGEAQAAQKS